MARNADTGGVAPTAENYFRAFLTGLGLPVTQANLNALYGVATLEGWNNRYNPLNVIQPEPGSTSFNSVGVQSYADFDSGVAGAVTLFEGSHWDGVRRALAEGNSTQDVLNAFAQAYTWDPGVNFSAGSVEDGARQIGANAGSGKAFADNGGGSLNAGAGGGGMPNPTAFDFQQAEGPLGSLLNTIPELHKLLQEAVSGGWSSAKFQQMVEQSSWYRTHSDSARTAIALQASDPATWGNNFNNLRDKIVSSSYAMGVTLRGAQLNNFVTRAIFEGWDDAQIQSHLASIWSFAGSKSYFGQAGQIEQQIKQIANDYGVPTTNVGIANTVHGVLMGNTVDAYKEQAIKQAQGIYRGVAGDINENTTLRQVADPYIATMSNLLELDPQTINYNDPMVKKALMGTPLATEVSGANAQRGTPGGYSATPLWQFEQLVRQDPRWQYTQNAMDSTSTALMTLGRDLGKVG